MDLLELMRSPQLSRLTQNYEGMNPDLLRAELTKQLQMQGRQMDLSTMPPEQMMLLLRTLRQPTATTGIRG